MNEESKNREENFLKSCDMKKIQDIGVRLTDLLTNSNLTMLEGMITLKLFERAFLSTCAEMVEDTDEKSGTDRVLELFDSFDIIINNEIQKEAEESGSEKESVG